MKKWVAYEREHKNNSVFTVSKKFNILSFSFYYVKNGLTSNSKYSIYRHHLAISSCGNHSTLSHNAKSQGAKEGRFVVLIQCTARDAIQIQGRFWLGQGTGQCCEMITGNSTFTLKGCCFNSNPKQCCCCCWLVCKLWGLVQFYRSHNSLVVSWEYHKMGFTWWADRRAWTCLPSLSRRYRGKETGLCEECHGVCSVSVLQPVNVILLLSSESC